MSQSNKTVSLITGVALVGAGMAMGYFIRPIVSPPVAVVAPAEPAADSGPGNIVVINESTVNNMGMETGKFQVRNYNEPIRIPGEVVERNPGGRREIIAPVGGRVETVHVSEGQSVAPGEKLFDLQITDEELSSTQVDLLSVIAEIEAVRARLGRMRGLQETGAVAGKRVTDIEIELRKLNGREQALMQELTLRGVDEANRQKLLDTGSLVTSLTVFAPEMGSRSSDSSRNFYTVESVKGIQGKNIPPGGSLCELTNHGSLLIKGMAFESDVQKISAANADGKTFAAEFGDAPDVTRIEDLPLLSIDNRVDDSSQTYPVFVEIENEIMGQSKDARGRLYVQWRFKPGQRVHLEVPAKVWEDGVVIPVEALVREGAEAFVFQKLNHDHGVQEVPVVEFQKVPVRVLYSDQRFAVLEQQISLDLFENYVLTQAYQVNLALRQAASGGANDHGHSHD